MPAKRATINSSMEITGKGVSESSSCISEELGHLAGQSKKIGKRIVNSRSNLKAIRVTKASKLGNTRITESAETSEAKNQINKGQDDKDRAMIMMIEANVRCLENMFNPNKSSKSLLSSLNDAASKLDSFDGKEAMKSREEHIQLLSQIASELPSLEMIFRSSMAQARSMLDGLKNNL